MTVEAREGVIARSIETTSNDVQALKSFSVAFSLMRTRPKLIYTFLFIIAVSSVSQAAYINTKYSCLVLRSQANIMSQKRDCLGPYSRQGKRIFVRITGTLDNGYYPVSINGKTGYMAAQFIVNVPARADNKNPSPISLGSDQTGGVVAPAVLPSADDLINPPTKPASGNAIKHLNRMSASNKQCMNSYVKHRGPIRKGQGAFHGLVVTMARSVCRSHSDPIKAAMIKGGGSTTRDIFKYHRLGRSSEKQIMVNLYGLLLGHSFKETTGRFWLGVDILNKRSMSRAISAEGGLCQTSYDIHGLKSRLGRRGMLKVIREYEKNPSLCLNNVFSKGMSTKRGRGIIGRGVGARFQRLMRSCPAAAAEHCAIAVRHARRHYGPLRFHRQHSKASKSLPACQRTFSAAYDYVQSNRARICPQLGIQQPSIFQKQKSQSTTRSQ